jgi:hypothetical protein
MRKTLWISMLVLTVVLSACGGASQPNVPPAASGSTPFIFALPRVVIDLDESGNPSVFGLKVADLSPLIGPGAANPILDKATIDKLVAGGVQNIEVRQAGNALELAVNGKLMPHVGWDDQSLATAGKLAPLAGISAANADTIVKLLPAIRRLGLDVVLNLPRPAGVAAIPPLQGPSPAITSTAPLSPTAILRADIQFDEQGRPSTLGVTPAELAAMGIPINSVISPQTIAELQASGIQHLEIRTKPSGLTVYANNQALPNLTYNQPLLGNAIDLYSKLTPNTPFAPLLGSVPAFVDGADIDVVVHLPKVAGQQDIPVQLHP